MVLNHKIIEGMQLHMQISLIIGTLNRVDYLAHCLESLNKQIYKNFETIIIDQSSNDETEKLIDGLGYDWIKYKQVDYKGLSKARNDAIRMASGDVFCLIDDDAYYEEDYLLKIVEHIKNNSKLIISGFLIDGVTKRDFVDYSKVPEGKPLSYWRITRYCPSPAISFTRELIESVGVFDEEFGVGAKYGAAEETDLLLRAKKKGFSVIHYKDVRAQHPHKWVVNMGDNKAKSYGYSYGIGAMYKKNTCGNLCSKIGFVYLERVARDIVKGLINKEDWELYKNLTHGFKDYQLH